MSKSSSSKMEKIAHVILAIIIIAPIVGITAYIIDAKNIVVEGLKELTIQREAAFVKIRPAFINYKNKNGVFPDRLQQLVPVYADLIPECLQSPEDEFPIMAIKYKTEGSNAFFYYHTRYGEAIMMVYDIGKNVSFRKN